METSNEEVALRKRNPEADLIAEPSVAGYWDVTSTGAMTSTKEKVLEFVRNNEGVGYLDVAHKCGLTLREAVRICKELVAEKKLQAEPAR